ITIQPRKLDGFIHVFFFICAHLLNFPPNDTNTRYSASHETKYNYIEQSVTFFVISIPYPSLVDCQRRAVMHDRRIR
ncbi:hypothetical protein ACSACS_003672, partial [Escherichia coli]